MLVDAVVIIAAGALFVARFIDLSIFSDALDPLLRVFYALAWLGVFGAVVTLWAAISFYGATAPAADGRVFIIP